MHDFEQVRTVKERVEARLRKYPGVHAVGIGEKYVNGKGTGETAILVLVLEKKGQDRLKPEEAVPAEIEGIKTDVIQVPMPQLHMAGNPNNLTVGFTDGTFTGFKFTGQDKPGAGLIVRVEFTGTPTTADPPNFAITYETSDDDTLTTIATNVASVINGDLGLPGLNATSTGAVVTVNPPPGGTVKLTD